MSLINDMLNDLEKRGDKNEAADELDFLAVNDSIPEQKPRSWFWPAVIVVLFLIQAVVLWVLTEPVKSGEIRSRVDGDLAEYRNELASRRQAAQSEAGRGANKSSSRQALAMKPVRVDLEQDGERSVVSINMPRKVGHSVNRMGSQGLEVFLPRLTANIGQIEGDDQGVVDNIEQISGPDGVLLVINTRADFDLDSDIVATQNPVLILTLTGKADIESRKPATNVLVEVARAESSSRSNSAGPVEAPAVARTAQPVESVTAIKKKADSSESQSRAAITTMLRRGDMAAAATALDSHLQRFAEDHEAWLMKAHMALSREDYPAAETVFAGPLKNAEATPESLELQAVLKQRSGDYAESLALYRRLLNIQPNRGKWWMGAAIALQAMNQKPEALRAYQRATRDPALGQTLMQYARSQVLVLGG